MTFFSKLLFTAAAIAVGGPHLFAAIIPPTEAIALVSTTNFHTRAPEYSCYQDATAAYISHAGCDGEFTLGLLGWGSAWATAEYGRLHAEATAGFDGLASAFSNSAGAGAAAYFHDTITLGVCPPIPNICFQAGIVEIAGSLSGQVSTTDPLGVNAGGDFTVGLWTDDGRSASCEANLSSGVPVGALSCSTRLNVHAGDTVHIDGALGAGVTLRSGFGAVSGSASFGNTAWISGLTVLDLNGQPAAGVSIVSGSGVDYTSITEFASAPEPSAWMLIGSGLLLLGFGAVRPSCTRAGSETATDRARRV